MMSKTVQARLDKDSLLSLQRLAKRTGLSPSEIVRRGIRLVDSIEGSQASWIIGTGKFDSGITDLGSNKRHLRGFGK
jgi:hypothetical protein